MCASIDSPSARARSERAALSTSTSSCSLCSWTAARQYAAQMAASGSSSSITIGTTRRALSPGAGNVAFPEELIGFEGEDRALHDKVLRLRLREFAQSQGAAEAPAGNVVPLGAKPKPGNPFRDVFFTADELEQFLLMTHELMLRVGERVAYVGASKQSA